jgi:hypothetical protein
VLTTRLKHLKFLGAFQEPIDGRKVKQTWVFLVSTMAVFEHIELITLVA